MRRVGGRSPDRVALLVQGWPLENVALMVLSWEAQSSGSIECVLVCWDGLQMLVWGFFISTVALWHATFMVNSVCHLWGTRPNPAGDGSRNNFLVALLTLGEGWHNNHHRWAYSARHGLRWWQLDITWLLMKQLRLVRDLRLPARRVAPART